MALLPQSAEVAFLRGLHTSRGNEARIQQRGRCSRLTLLRSNVSADCVDKYIATISRSPAAVYREIMWRHTINREASAHCEVPAPRDPKRYFLARATGRPKELRQISWMGHKSTLLTYPSANPIVTSLAFHDFARLIMREHLLLRRRDLTFIERRQVALLILTGRKVPTALLSDTSCNVHHLLKRFAYLPRPVVEFMLNQDLLNQLSRAASSRTCASSGSVSNRGKQRRGRWVDVDFAVLNSSTHSLDILTGILYGMDVLLKVTFIAILALSSLAGIGSSKRPDELPPLQPSETSIDWPTRIKDWRQAQQIIPLCLVDNWIASEEGAIVRIHEQSKSISPMMSRFLDSYLGCKAWQEDLLVPHNSEMLQYRERNRISSPTACVACGKVIPGSTKSSSWDANVRTSDEVAPALARRWENNGLNRFEFSTAMLIIQKASMTICWREDFESFGPQDVLCRDDEGLSCVWCFDNDSRQFMELGRVYEAQGSCRLEDEIEEAEGHSGGGVLTFKRVFESHALYPLRVDRRNEAAPQHDAFRHQEYVSSPRLHRVLAVRLPNRSLIRKCSSLLRPVHRVLEVRLPNRSLIRERSSLLLDAFGHRLPIDIIARRACLGAESKSCVTLQSCDEEWKMSVATEFSVKPYLHRAALCRLEQNEVQRRMCMNDLASDQRMRLAVDPRSFVFEDGAPYIPDCQWRFGFTLHRKYAYCI
ncbi:uncharacterized protein MYCFIDRAFT_180066 [Pseudocercospora fijiensis CIRAD86]|uniref:Uncharacterized protein n=1 Tax=Pseudocercospora fijiensis (strain CIRAD86) TaxID=383855 RepID=M2ZDL5_PSEFD|nr:uncharacterized protein MYCFIDRAFT_180066 [Pseudocercospora fijiensis CIRAD86]EME77189.1 hypothetical protein MYCFIDRAFT_180066 [Pseudocercospora fijiensis CIRAD86]